MTRKVITVILMLFFCSCTKNIDNKNEEINITNTGIVDNTNTGAVEEPKELTEEEIKKKKVEALRKKLALRGLILKGDINVKNQEYTSALIKYLKIHKEIPEDKATIKKLGDVYFNLKKFKQAYGYYSQIKDYERLDKDRVVNTLLSFNKLNKDTVDNLYSEISNMPLTPEESFYYRTSLDCIKDFSLCKQHFQDYFENKKIEEAKELKDLKDKENQEKDDKQIQEDEENIKKEKFEKLYNIEKALTNYENFQVDDLIYKGALVSGAFFENGLYPIAIEISKKLLSERKDYKPLLKLVAKSYYELGNYVDAKLFLIEYNRLVEEDPEASYFLGVVYEKIHEYLLSTIHFQKALDTGYDDKYNLNKRILFNYYELGDVEKMLDVFKVLVNNHVDQISINDFSLAIYYHIVNDDMLSAKNISNISLEKFPDSEMLNGYMGWIIMEEINQEKEKETSNENGDVINNEDIYFEAEKYINKGLEIDNKSPMLNLVKGKLEMNKGDISKGFIYFKKTVSLDNNGDFGKIAKQELEKIKVTNAPGEEDIKE